MRLLRVGPAGEESAAIMDADGRVWDASSIVPDITPDILSPEQLERIRSKLSEAAGTLPEIDLSTTRVGPPLTGIGKVVCVGLNYRKHANETGQSIPLEPILFMKAADTIGGPNDAVLIPPTSVKTDYEVELAVVIGSTARYLEESDDALAYVAGFAISNDVSEREFQLERGGQWDKGKNCETFNPLGPVLVTSDEIADVQKLTMTLSVNGEVRQSSSTADMIFSVEFIVRYVSQFMVLYPGDIINTGTPEGVGLAFSPPRFLVPGDKVQVEIQGLGRQEHRFERASARRA